MTGRSTCDGTATLAELRALGRAYPKQKASLCSRGSTCQVRQQKAAAKGVSHTRVNYLLRQLFGGQSLSCGLIQDIENQIAANIQTIERMSLRELPQRSWWLSWYGFPEKVRDNMREAEDNMGELETLVQDGGELHRMLDAKSGQPASAPVAVLLQREPAAITVET